MAWLSTKLSTGAGAQKVNNFGIKYLPRFSRVELKHGR
jgi:hypothetical protein